MNATGLISAAAAVVLTVAAGPIWAINKCTADNGKVSFQDAPCAGRGGQIVVRPATGEAPSPAVTDTPAPTATQRVNQQLSQMAAERKRRDIEMALPNAYAERDGHSAACDREIEQLRLKKRSANNNLAGATWEQSLSTEMAAVASRCETRNRNINANIEGMRAECLAMGGCK